MIEFSELKDTELSALNLERDGERLRIVIPPLSNLYHMTLGRQLANGNQDRTAMVFEHADGTVESQSFAAIEEKATSLAAALRGLGYQRGDLVGLHTGQHPDTAIAHMAICKIGGVAVTLSQLYGPDTLCHAMNDCEVRVLLTSDAAWAPLRAKARTLFPHLQHVLLRNAQSGEIDLGDAFAADAAGFHPCYTGAQDPALLMYTSGSTGKPKGILHGHRVLAAYTPSINLFFNRAMDSPDAIYWSPSDWAWVGGLLDMLFPAWMAGRAIATSEARFNADWAYGFMARHKVTHSFLAPTAIKRLAQTASPREQYDLSLQIICTGGEALAAETLDWAERKLKVVCNEFYGLTEVNHLIGNCAALYPRKAGSMGRAYPGHQVRLVDDQGRDVADGEAGEIVTTADAPTRFLGYLNNPGQEAEMKLGAYLRTHDLAVRDSEGYFWYKGRSDDLIKSSGFRIGPTEIEECLIAHPAVSEAAVIGKPDSERGSIVKAFVKTHVDIVQDDTLVERLKQHVREKLAAYKAPREIAFVKDFEMTSSGKINRRALRDAETG
jgi:acetyl-CoA synthetase